MTAKRDSKNNPDPKRPSHENLPRNVLDNLMEGCQVISREWKYLYVNDAIAKQGRRSKEQLLGRTMMEAYPGIQDTSMFTVLRRCMEERTIHRMVNEFTFPDGAKGWFELSFEPVPEGVFILSTEITERKRAEEALRRLNRTLAMLSECNQAIIRATDENLMLTQICGIVFGTGGYLRASIGLAQGSEGAIRPVAQAGGDEGGTDTDRVHWEDIMWDKGPPEHAGRTGEVAVARVTAKDEEYAPWREEASKRGVASCIALPLRAGDKVIGVLTVYSGEPDAFNVNEMSLLVEMASDLSYGLVALRTGIAHRKAEARIVHLNSVLRGIRGVTNQSVD